jgi:tetratricopeptide (TPR) repeat protein
MRSDDRLTSVPATDVPPEAAGRLPGWASPLAIVALGALAYADALRGPMVFDDISQLQANPLAHDLAFTASWAGYRAFPSRWVAYLSFALNHAVGGFDPLGYHLANVAIHLGTALLVAALVRTALRCPRLHGSALAPHAELAAFLAGALFVSHPLQTQAVTYLVQRMTSLATLFYVAAVVLYLRARLSSGPRRRWAWTGGALLAALLATRTKEIAVTLPLALAAAELCLLDRPRRRAWALLLPFVAVAALVPASRLGGTGVAGLAEATRVQTTLPRLEYLLTELPVLVSYLFLLLVPIGQNLDHDPPLHHTLLDPQVAASAVVLLALAGAAALLLRRPDGRPASDPALRLVAFGILWWLLAHTVESSIIPIVDVMNEHRVYLPSVGAFTAIGVGGILLLRRWLGPARAPRAALAAGIAVALALTGLTAMRNTVWSSAVSLWADAARKSPEKPRPVQNLGTALAEAGRLREAIAPLRRAVELEPGSAFARAQLAAALLSLGRVEEGERELREALRLAPADVEATYNLATLLWETGRRDEGRRWFGRFLDIAPPEYAEARRTAAAFVGR